VSTLDKPTFEYGPIARGSYHAMLWSTLLVGLFIPRYVFTYILFLIFLGIGLRPLLIATGLYQHFQEHSANRDDRINQKIKQGYNRSHAKENSRQKDKINEMRKKMMPKKNS